MKKKEFWTLYKIISFSVVMIMILNIIEDEEYIYEKILNWASSSLQYFFHRISKIKNKNNSSLNVN